MRGLLHKVIKVCLLLFVALVISACSNTDANSSVVDNPSSSQAIKMGQLYSASGPPFPIFRSGIYKYRNGFICWAGFYLSSEPGSGSQTGRGDEIAVNLIGNDDCTPRTLESFNGGYFDAAFKLKSQHNSHGNVFENSCESTCFTRAYLKSNNVDYFAVCSTSDTPGPINLLGKCQVISHGIFGVIVVTTYIFDSIDQASYASGSKRSIMAGVLAIENLYTAIKQGV